MYPLVSSDVSCFDIAFIPSSCGGRLVLRTYDFVLLKSLRTLFDHVILQVPNSSNTHPHGGDHSRSITIERYGI